jgi:uncharacterized membrane protein YedE/YeeE
MAVPHAPNQEFCAILARPVRDKGIALSHTTTAPLSGVPEEARTHTAPAASPDFPVLMVALAGVAIIIARLLAEPSLARIALFLDSVALGAVFLFAEFSYTASFRNVLVRRDGSGLAAGLLVAAVAALVIVPVTALVHGYAGYVSPVSCSVAIGAALFAAGMQLANGCASGSLYAAGAGSRRLWIALPFFILGSVLGTLILPAAERLPSAGAIGLGLTFGPWLGLLATLGVLGVAMFALVGSGPRPRRNQIAAAVAIGVLAAIAFLLSGIPWGVTWGFTVWGAKIAAALGLPIAHAPVWQAPAARAALHGSVLDIPSSLMDFGMLLGAMLPAAWRGRFRSWSWPGTRGAIAAALGGLAMGVGARLAFGCNIGALVGGLSSGSLHGLLWLVAGLAGTWIGVKLRPLFGLAVR